MAFADNVADVHHELDDISLFLRQLLHRASPSHPPPAPLPSTFPSVGTHAPDKHLPCFSSIPISHNRTLHQQIAPVNRTFDDSLTSIIMTSPPPAYLPAHAGSNLSSDSVTGSGTIRNADNYCGQECDCECEEAMEEAETKEPPSRNHSKRSRAAEFHNLSEKRRRSRINEKMKALQNLIPNSNKTDKASMLDEAIEYLKQLQLQVQMLSVRNGMSLHPMCLPGVSGILHPAEGSQVGLDFSKRSTSLDKSMRNEMNIMPGRSHAVLNSAKQCLSSLPTVSSVLNSEPLSYGLESCLEDDFGPFQFRNYPQPQAVCRDQNVPRVQLTANTVQSKSPVTTMAPSFYLQKHGYEGAKSAKIWAAGDASITG